jgi:hypothetical protein
MIKWTDEDPTRRYFYRGTEYSSVNAAIAAIDQLLGPDPVPQALANIEAPEGSQVGTVTKAQRRVLYQLARDILLRDGLGEAHVAGYEFKRFALSWGWGGRLFLVTEVGSKTDEHTMAAVFCRNHRHIVLGPRGGLTDLHAARYSKRRRGYHNVLNWGARG